MATHELKTWPEPFEAMWRGDKTAEFRKDDRDPRYEVGDYLHLCEWNPETGSAPYPMRRIAARVTDIRRSGKSGIPEGYAMLSVTILDRYPKDI